MTTGVVSKKMKIAKIIPIFKKGDSCEPSNYRPISLLSVFDKLFEKIVCRKTVSFLERNKVIYDYQFGFRKNHSTTLALLEVTDKIYKLLDEGNYVAGVFFDLQKAFDTVDHAILLHKLSNYGIRGIVHKWFESYLTDRMQYTTVSEHCSKPLTVNCGVPQGSVLGPLLFILYMNDISRAVSDAKIKLFADDTNMFTHDKDLTVLTRKCNKYLGEINSWFLANRLSLNVQKTCYMLFKPRVKMKTRNTIDLFINGLKIDQSSSSTYLGITLDEDLKWTNHIDYVYRKIIRFTGIFYKMRHIMLFTCLKNLYFALVYPHILYGVELYANTCKTYLQKLNVLNNKLLRLMQKASIYTHVLQLYITFNTLPIERLFKRQLLLFVRKCMHFKELIPPIYLNYFTLNLQVHNHDTRTRNDLHLCRFNTNFGKRCLNFQASILWKLLPIDLKLKSSDVFFNNSIYKYLVAINE